MRRRNSSRVFHLAALLSLAAVAAADPLAIAEPEHPGIRHRWTLTWAGGSLELLGTPRATERGLELPLPRICEPHQWDAVAVGRDGLEVPSANGPLVRPWPRATPPAWALDINGDGAIGYDDVAILMGRAGERAR